MLAAKSHAGRRALLSATALILLLLVVYSSFGNQHISFATSSTAKWAQGHLSRLIPSFAVRSLESNIAIA
jgi:hypothetical protein